MASFDPSHSGACHRLEAVHSRAGMLLTFTVAGDGGRTSKVAIAGAPVSPALISPPSPLDLLRNRGTSWIDDLSGVNVSLVESNGKASPGMVEEKRW